MPLNVAIAGLKGHQGVILEGIAQSPDVRLAAVWDDNPEALAGVKGWACADENTRTYDSWEEMLEREPIDILGEAGVDSERHRILLAAIRRGISCISEKPLANALPDLADLRLAVEQHKVQLSMLLTMRFEPAYRRVREVILGGEIGEVCLATFQKSYRLGNRPAWQRDKATFSGIIPFIGIHALDTIRWCTGREFTEVFGWCGNTAHPEIGDMEDQGQVLCRLDNGGTASARLDYCRPAAAPTHGDDRIRVAGSEGVVESLYCGAQVTLITREDGPRELELRPQPENQFLDFLRAVRGEGPCQVPTEDCLRMTEVVLKARASARSGMAYRADS